MRTPRPAAALLLAAALALAGCDGRAQERAATPRRLGAAARGWNVLLLSIDTLRADRLGAYGYRVHPNSPNLDALLASGVRFDRAMSQRASTWPSLASVLSGLYPSGHGVAENGYGFPNDLPTLPKLLHAAGYRTGAFLSNMCRANHQGWDSFACTGGNDARAVRTALAWANGLDAAKPYLLWIHLFGAHNPYYNGGDGAQKLDPGYTGPLGPRRRLLDRVMLEKMTLTPADRRHLDALYDAAVEGTDRRVGTLLAGLRAAGKLDRTVIVLVADHGEELYQHNGYLYHACSVYQTTLHVPLGFAAPGLLRPGAAVPQTVELIDILPTLLGLVGVTPPVEQHGRSLVPYLERPGGGGEGKPAFSEYGAAPVHTVIQGDWKLVHNPAGFQPECIPDAPPGHYPIGLEELYDLSADPGETRNLAASQPARVTELSQLIRHRFSGLTNRLKTQEIPEELRRELKALGYAAH
jgi:arylsulfatase A-like enzyme